MGEVIAVEPRAQGLVRLKIASRFDPESIALGASIACSGICLTVVATGSAGGRGWFAVEAAAETLRVTSAGTWSHASRINLERSLKVGDELGGHFVSGHIDGIAEVVGRADVAEMADIRLRAPAALARFIAPKGSVALDGVSLTVNDVGGAEFSVLIIPHTLAVTTMGAARAGDRLNLEIDTMARYAARLLEFPPSAR